MSNTFLFLYHCGVFCDLKQLMFSLLFVLLFSLETAVLICCLLSLSSIHLWAAGRCNFPNLEVIKKLYSKIDSNLHFLQVCVGWFFFFLCYTDIKCSLLLSVPLLFLSFVRFSDELASTWAFWMYVAWPWVSKTEVSREKGEDYSSHYCHIWLGLPPSCSAEPVERGPVRKRPGKKEETLKHEVY